MKVSKNALADKLVYMTSFVIPLIFLPQIYVLVQSKTTAGISLLMLIFSALVQAIYLFKAIVSHQRALTVSVLSSLIPLNGVIILVIYYRYF
ncbi:MAG: PQ-loop domain-containing transporter [Candidatus Parcubacteria bacterium]|nr:PQ-loop domain-containing transporter [Candidatus Parcubacteria bacterium]